MPRIIRSLNADLQNKANCDRNPPESKSGVAEWVDAYSIQGVSETFTLTPIPRSERSLASRSEPSCLRFHPLIQQRRKSQGEIAQTHRFAEIRFPEIDTIKGIALSA